MRTDIRKSQIRFVGKSLYVENRTQCRERWSAREVEKAGDVLKLRGKIVKIFYSEITIR